ncbi:hypothetical protein [Nonomuraea sp. B1E8]|uniref:hypothetical protein n=1 Tax=unclassified Nonomuraea TaxID=2593643 RepID=UPI00325D406A
MVSKNKAPPLPSVAAAPYVCDHVPLHAVQLMTGLRDPVVQGGFNMAAGKESDGQDYGTGSCRVYRPTGKKVLQISLYPAGSEKEVEFTISQGVARLPEVVPGAVGYYDQIGDVSDAHATAVLVHGLDEVIVELIEGVKGRDNAADVMAMMKLVAPKLILDATPVPKKAKD